MAGGLSFDSHDTLLAQALAEELCSDSCDSSEATSEGVSVRQHAPNAAAPATVPRLSLSKRSAIPRVIGMISSRSGSQLDEMSTYTC